MTDEEMADKHAEEYRKTFRYYRAWHGQVVDKSPSTIVEQSFKDGFLAGLKAGRSQWHDLEKDPTDLPKDNHNVWCKALDHYGEGWYDKDTNTWTLIYRGYHLHCIEAWCEIPTFDKE